MSDRTKGWLKGFYCAVLVAFLTSLYQFFADPTACATWGWAEWIPKLKYSGALGIGAAILYLINSPLPSKAKAIADSNTPEDQPK